MWRSSPVIRFPSQPSRNRKDLFPWPVPLGRGTVWDSHWWRPGGRKWARFGRACPSSLCPPRRPFQSRNGLAHLPLELQGNKAPSQHCRWICRHAMHSFWSTTAQSLCRTCVGTLCQNSWADIQQNGIQLYSKLDGHMTHVGDGKNDLYGYCRAKEKWSNMDYLAHFTWTIFYIDAGSKHSSYISNAI